MSVESGLLDRSFPANEDLTNDRYRYVVLQSDGTVARPNAATDKPLGILQNAPAAGAAASVRLIGCGGTSKVVLGATLATGAAVALEYNDAADAGKAKAPASTQYPAGLLLKGGAEDELGEVLLESMTVVA